MSDLISLNNDLNNIVTSIEGLPREKFGEFDCVFIMTNSGNGSIGCIKGESAAIAAALAAVIIKHPAVETLFIQAIYAAQLLKEKK